MLKDIESEEETDAEAEEDSQELEEAQAEIFNEDSLGPP